MLSPSLLLLVVVQVIPVALMATVVAESPPMRRMGPLEKGKYTARKAGVRLDCWDFTDVEQPGPLLRDNISNISYEALAIARLYRCEGLSSMQAET